MGLKNNRTLDTKDQNEVQDAAYTTPRYTKRSIVVINCFPASLTLTRMVCIVDKLKLHGSNFTDALTGQ